MIHGINHFTVVCAAGEQTLAFYRGLLGLQAGPRPDLGFPGAWLHAGGPQAVLHLVWGRALPAQRSGAIDHIAFSASELRAVKNRLDAAGVPYDLRRQAASGSWQLFCHDPNGARIELSFDASETL